MGWINFVKIPQYEIAIEVNRCVSEIADYEIKTLDDVLDDQEDTFDDDLKETAFSGLSIRDIALLYKAYDIVCDLVTMDISTLLLYVLTKRGIEYEIVSENNVPRSQLQEEGYKIIPLINQ